MHPGN